MSMHKEGPLMVSTATSKGRAPKRGLAVRVTHHVMYLKQVEG